MTLGPGRHFGEWWGAGIQRKYGIADRRWSLFNVTRWALHGEPLALISKNHEGVETFQNPLPPCVGLVPTLYRGEFSSAAVEKALDDLAAFGSKAAHGFMKPEGVVVYHVAGRVGFKKTLEKDELPKSLAGSAA